MKLIGGYAALIIYLWVTTWRPWIVLAAVCTAVLATISSSALGQSQLLHLGVSGLSWPPSAQPSLPPYRFYLLVSFNHKKSGVLGFSCRRLFGHLAWSPYPV